MSRSNDSDRLVRPKLLPQLKMPRRDKWPRVLWDSLTFMLKPPSVDPFQPNPALICCLMRSSRRFGYHCVPFTGLLA
ncbi:hypothetical protein D3C87_1250610 [compost metagenome]